MLLAPRAPPLVLSHRLQRAAGGEHPSADDKRLMMSGPRAFFSLKLLHCSGRGSGRCSRRTGLLLPCTFLLGLALHGNITRLTPARLLLPPFLFQARPCLPPWLPQKEEQAAPGEAEPALSIATQGWMPRFSSLPAQQLQPFCPVPPPSPCWSHTGQLPGIPPAFKISSRTLGWALFAALAAYQLSAADKVTCSTKDRAGGKGSPTRAVLWDGTAGTHSTSVCVCVCLCDHVHPASLVC